VLEGPQPQGEGCQGDEKGFGRGCRGCQKDVRSLSYYFLIMALNGEDSGFHIILFVVTLHPLNTIPSGWSELKLGRCGLEPSQYVVPANETFILEEDRT
jgi:hypothetical protein